MNHTPEDMLDWLAWGLEMLRQADKMAEVHPPARARKIDAEGGDPLLEIERLIVPMWAAVSKGARRDTADRFEYLAQVLREYIVHSGERPALSVVGEGRSRTWRVNALLRPFRS